MGKHEPERILPDRQLDELFSSFPREGMETDRGLLRGRQAEIRSVHDLPDIPAQTGGGSLCPVQESAGRPWQDHADQ